jgi:hypothetical protein
VPDDIDLDLGSDDDETWRGVRVTVWDDEAGLVKGVVLEFYKAKIVVAWGDEPPYTVMWYDVDEIVERHGHMDVAETNKIINLSIKSIAMAKNEIDEDSKVKVI